jgi:hypothetical protein
MELWNTETTNGENIEVAEDEETDEITEEIDQEELETVMKISKEQEESRIG